MTVAHRFDPFGTTIFTEMTALAIEHQAVNLSQGFPDFDGPDFIKQAAAEAMAGGRNQYARMAGLPELTSAIARHWQQQTGEALDPDTQVTVTSGCTEALAAAFLGLLNPADEVILFEPFYDSYRACAAMAGAAVKTVTLRPPGPDARVGMDVPAVDQAFTFDERELRAAFTPRTRAILLNTPHNPTGKVFTRAELELISSLCIEHDVIAITDEVYEHLTYERDLPHVRIATLPGMADRTLTLSSLGKTFSLTGWKIGWGIGSPQLGRALRAAHQFITFCTATPLQFAAAVALEKGGPAVAELACKLAGRCNLLGTALEKIGFRVFRPAGTYFILADHTPISAGRSDVEFCRWLTTEVGVATIPPSVFYAEPSRGRSLVRFAFCKREQTLGAAIERLGKLGG
jgi:aspartate/methionine/tyrosine aminotransferase